jgi:hypothetical protein
VAFCATYFGFDPSSATRYPDGDGIELVEEDTES